MYAPYRIGKTSKTSSRITAGARRVYPRPISDRRRRVIREPRRPAAAAPGGLRRALGRACGVVTDEDEGVCAEGTAMGSKGGRCAKQRAPIVPALSELGMLSLQTGRRVRRVLTHPSSLANTGGMADGLP